MLPHVDLENRQLIGPGIDIVGLIQSIAERLFGADFGSVSGILSIIWNIYSLIAITLGLIFFIGFVYAKIRLGELSALEQATLRKEEEKWLALYGGKTTKSGRWQEIMAHMHDDNPNSWKIAIIEADIFLEEVLADAGYIGVTIGEKLKSANSASFTTIQDAWEAHKIRNEVAHAGEGDFVLTRKLAQETMMRFERIFREFGALNEKKPEVSHASHGH